MMDEKAKDPSVKEDVVHAEKAIGTLPGEDNPELDKRLNRKFDLHILPWLFGIWWLIPS